MGNHYSVDGLVELLQCGVLVQRLRLSNSIAHCLGTACGVAARVGTYGISCGQLRNVFIQHLLQVVVGVLLPKVAYYVVAAPRSVFHKGRIHHGPHVYIGSCEIEGVGAEFGHGIAVHIHLVFLATIDT